MVEEKSTQKQSAMKAILKSKVVNEKLLRGEVEALQRARHPTITELRDVFEDTHYL